MLVSVCMIVKNEADCIGRALQSIPEGYERIVVDTGSTDQTVEIAKANSALVFSMEWPNNFSDARNFSVNQASGQYIFILDADEVLTAGAEEEIASHICQYANQAASVLINNISSKEKTKHRMVRFFPNHNDYRFEGIVHEQLYKGREQAPFVHSGITVEHYGYEQETYEAKKKYERYLHLYQQELETNGKDGYMLYQLGKLHYSAQKYSEAYEAFASCLEEMESNKLYFPVMLTQLGYTLKELGKSREAFDLLEMAVQQYPNYPDLHFVLGVLAIDVGAVEAIPYYFNQCIAIGETKVYSSIDGVGSYRAWYNLGLYYELIGNSAEAIRCYKHAVQSGYEPAGARLDLFSEGI